MLMIYSWALLRNIYPPSFYSIQLGRVDELGSGVLNVHRLINQYAGKGKPLCIEDAIFTMEIPVPNMQSEGAFEYNTPHFLNQKDSLV